MPLIVLPTKTDDSIGRVKTDKPRAFPRTADLRYDVPADEYERLKQAIIDIADEVGIHVGDSGDLNTRLNNIGDEIAAALEPEQEWDGAGITQLDGADAFASAGQSITPSRQAETTHPKGGYLRFTGGSSGTTGTRAAVRLVTAPLAAAGNYLLEFDMRTQGSGSTYGGFSIFGDLTGGAGHYYGYNYFFGNSGWKSRVDDGVLVSDGTTNNFLIAAATLGQVRIWVRGSKAGGAQPKFRIHGIGMPDNAAARGSHLKQSQWARDPAPAGWNALPCLRWGFALQAGGGTALGTMDVDDWRVYRLS